MTSEMFYRILKRYVLTEEQMEENGYPTPNNLTKSLDEGKFEQIERTCDRCQKKYGVDDNGMQLVIFRNFSEFIEICSEISNLISG